MGWGRARRLFSGGKGQSLWPSHGNSLSAQAALDPQPAWRGKLRDYWAVGCRRAGITQLGAPVSAALISCMTLTVLCCLGFSCLIWEMGLLVQVLASG